MPVLNGGLKTCDHQIVGYLEYSRGDGRIIHALRGVRSKECKFKVAVGNDSLGLVSAL